MVSIDRFRAARARTYLNRTDEARSSAASTQTLQLHKQRAGRPDSRPLRPNLHQLAAARQTIEQADDIRHRKVAALKTQIDSGTYHVPAHVLARKMLHEADSTSSD